ISLGTVSVSIGVAAFPDSSRDAEGLLRAADAALYKAKNEGRDRAVLAAVSVEHLPFLSHPPVRKA
ncbi:MAG TPA: diguanylate cyclase, partial [Polyangiaceae bacterium]|nr:diguanylate cyclase [Polyangiaceae bacterium]